jgi:hypothetical protein
MATYPYNGIGSPPSRTHAAPANQTARANSANNGTTTKSVRITGHIGRPMIIVMASGLASAIGRVLRIQALPAASACGNSAFFTRFALGGTSSLAASIGVTGGSSRGAPRCNVDLSAATSPCRRELSLRAASNATSTTARSIRSRWRAGLRSPGGRCAQSMRRSLPTPTLTNSPATMLDEGTIL